MGKKTSITRKCYLGLKAYNFFPGDSYQNTPIKFPMDFLHITQNSLLG